MLYGVIKTGTSWAVSAGVGIITGAALNKVVPLNSLQGKDKVLVTIGGAAISVMASAKVSTYVEEMFDEGKELIDDLRGIVRKTKEEKRKAKEPKK